MITPSTRDDVVDVCRRLRESYPVIGGGLVDKHLAPDDPAWEYAQRALGYVASRTRDDLGTELEAFASVSIDFLRLQARFMKVKQYARAGGAAGLVDDLYADESKMKGYYLDGLALTYALWPNHVHMIEFMGEAFAPRLGRGDRLVEIGVGHGLLAALIFDRVPGLHYVGVDISRSSLDYAEQALIAAGAEPDRITMVQADAQSGDLERLGGPAGFDALLCCEVLEHVDHPEAMLSAFHQAVGDHKPGFVSTVANMEAEDHVYLYNDVDEIRTMLAATGWSVTTDRPKVLPGAEDWDPLPVNYSAVISS